MAPIEKKTVKRLACLAKLQALGCQLKARRNQISREEGNDGHQDNGNGITSPTTRCRRRHIRMLKEQYHWHESQGGRPRDTRNAARRHYNRGQAPQQVGANADIKQDLGQGHPIGLDAGKPRPHQKGRHQSDN
jgi:hypothetical protein